MREQVQYAGIGELAERMASREVSPVDVVADCLARIDALQPRLNAFITVLAHRARQQAGDVERDLEAGRNRGPLHGIPVGIKDFYDTAGVRTTAAFEPFRNRVPARDAVAVRKLTDAGAVIVGKTNMHQLGMGTTGLESCFGPVRNPWNDAYIPGGSSSGSAAAVAAGLCWATLDTDAIGSCRLPAACCGVVGFKGTYGLIDPAGILEGEKADEAIVWLSHPAITARSARDALLVVNVLAARHVEPPRRTPLRIGAANTSGGDRQIAGACDAAIETLRTLGHQIVPARVPFDTPPMDNLKTIETDRATIAGRAFKDVDVIVLPTTTTPVPQVADAQGKPQALAAANTFFANYFGLPAVSVLCGFDRHGLPLGVQIIGRPWDDGVVLGLADQFQTATDWHTRHPVA